MPDKRSLARLLLLTAFALLLAACAPLTQPSSQATTPRLAHVQDASPATPASPQSAGTEQLAAYEEEGLFICNFEDDITIWQGYTQASETRIGEGEAPPEGFLPVAAWHNKYKDRWVKPAAGFVRSDEHVKLGTTAGHWSNTTVNTRIVATDIPHDWSDYLYLSFWAYSGEANDAAIEIVAYSESDATPEDDYFKKEIVIDWTGWRLFEIPLREFRAVRSPVGWHQIDYIKLASSGWSHDPKPTTDLYFDAMKLSNQRVAPLIAIELPENPMHPNLLLNQAELEEIKKKVERYPWAREAYRVLKANADAWSARSEIAVPRTGGGFYHAVDATAYQITLEHYDHANAARDMALMFHLTGDERYVPNAKAILLDYADKYLTYEIHDKAGRTGAQAEAGGRATPQGINEATWVIPLAWAYDLLYDQFTPQEREAIETRLMRPAAEIIMDNNEGRHNHQTWYNAGVGVIGFLLGDEELVWYALDKDDSGFRYQMQKSITADGMWYEGSMHYQMYVLQALFPLMEAAYHAGIDLYRQEPAYKGLFDFMVDYADANLRLPTFNDGRVVVLSEPDRAMYYEVAYRRLGDDRYASVLRNSARTDLLALLYGVGELPSVTSPDRQSRYFEASGLVALRSDAGDKRLQAVLNIMGYQGGHSHPDQLGLVFHGLDTVLAPDAGSIKYRMPAHLEYFKQSVAHNLVLVDGRSQAHTPPPKLRGFAAGEALQMVRATTDKAYPGVSLERTLLLTDDYLVDIVHARGDRAHTYDWVYHNQGRFASGDLSFRPVTEPLAQSNGYEYLQNVQAAAPWSGGLWQAVWTLDPNRHVRGTFVGQAGDSYFLADGLIAADKGDEIADYTVPVLIARREATATRFTTVLEPYRSTPAVRHIEYLSLLDENGGPLALEDGVALAIEREDGRDLLILDDKGQPKRVEDLRIDGRQFWASYGGDALRAFYLGMGSQVAGPDWTMRLEGLSTVADIEDVNVLLERPKPDLLRLYNIGVRSVGVELAGLTSTHAQIWQLSRLGRRDRQVRPTRMEDAFLRFVLAPQSVYEITN
ncbi:MAG: hypothetical protein D6775_17020 [Caldilineae bacterium]|nr:MAG: hypothetical protein D6775_17020 [Caldilineae bacterium]